MERALYTATDADGRQYLVTFWGDGTQDIATRPHEGATWGPPVTLVQE